MMELRQLIYFEAVARFGGFSRAAEQLRIAQPAVSAQIRRLETELGTVLLQRTTRRVALTHAGELFLARARTVLDQLDGARADLDDLAAVLRGHLRIGATLVLASIDLPRSLARFHRRYPGVTLALRTGLIAELLAELDSGTVDVVLGPMHDDLPASFAAEPLAAENLVLVTPPGRRLASAATLAAVRDEPFVCLPASSGLHALLVAAAAAAGFTPRIPFENYSPGSVPEPVSAGVGARQQQEAAVQYRVSSLVAGPSLRSLWRPKVTGTEHIPASGGVILASNHLSLVDSIFLPLMVDRPVTFAAKSEYFSGTRLIERATAAYMRATKQLAVDRTGARAGQDMLEAALGLLRQAGLFGISPRGTRPPDGRLYRGRVGVGWLALQSGTPVIPVAMSGTDRVLPPGRTVPRFTSIGLTLG